MLTEEVITGCRWHCGFCGLILSVLITISRDVYVVRSLSPTHSVMSFSVLSQCDELAERSHLKNNRFVYSAMSIGLGNGLMSLAYTIRGEHH